MTPAVVTLGMFDGVHRGHAAVLLRAGKRASACAAHLVTLTFADHPRTILGGGTAPPLLTPLSAKTRLLRRAGASRVRVLAFTPGLAAKGPFEFLADYVFPFHRLAALVVGYDFAMGRDREGTRDELARLGQRFGFTVETVGPLMEDGAPISSTRIREALAGGDVDLAQALLGRPYSLSGPVRSGDGRGTGLGFPTANLDPSVGPMWPGQGVYAAWVTGGTRQNVPSVVNVGTRPTVDGTARSVEAHLLDQGGDLVGEHLRVDFVHRLRHERKFNNLNELAVQIGKDAEAARGWLEKNPQSAATS